MDIGKDAESAAEVFCYAWGRAMVPNPMATVRLLQVEEVADSRSP